MEDDGNAFSRGTSVDKASSQDIPQPTDTDPAKAKTRSTLIQQKMVGQMYSGPLPRPEMLKGYEEILPGAADRIIKMAERQSSHRQDMEKGKRNDDYRIIRRGQDYGLIIALASFAVSAYLIFHDKYVPGSILSGGTLVGLVSVFMFGKRKKASQEGKQDIQDIAEMPRRKE
ncbi:MAG: DUF2335 domain-containing protein [Deltaproteobacteria bacterium]|nr:DUF2335 domain-containing protein [Deltaproteobacteria bacterium]